MIIFVNFPGAVSPNMKLNQGSKIKVKYKGNENFHPILDPVITSEEKQISKGVSR